MIDLEERAVKDTKVMKALKISEITHILAKTSKGDLGIMLRFGEDKYFFTLDSVPVETELNDTLMKIIYPKLIDELLG